MTGKRKQNLLFIPTLVSADGEVDIHSCAVTACVYTPPKLTKARIAEIKRERKRNKKFVKAFNALCNEYGVYPKFDVEAGYYPGEHYERIYLESIPEPEKYDVEYGMRDDFELNSYVDLIDRRK